ncbi:hypothetical protein L6261_00220, partial [Candidatus Parcubacteria bacterium]|nr:hypothetical protein [Candidatus Parcubacteria bacterium]
RQSSYLNLSQYKKPTLDRHTSPFHSEVREDKKQSFCHNGFCSAKSVNKLLLHKSLPPCLRGLDTYYLLLYTYSHGR